MVCIFYFLCGCICVSAVLGNKYWQMFILLFIDQVLLSLVYPVRSQMMYSYYSKQHNSVKITREEVGRH